MYEFEEHVGTPKLFFILAKFRNAYSIELIFIASYNQLEVAEVNFEKNCGINSNVRVLLFFHVCNYFIYNYFISVNLF